MKSKISLIALTTLVVSAGIYIFKNDYTKPDLFESAAIQFMKDELRQDLNQKMKITFNDKLVEKEMLIREVLEVSKFHLIGKDNNPDGSTTIRYEIETLDSAELNTLQDSYIKAATKNSTQWSTSEAEMFIRKVISKKANRKIVNALDANFVDGKLIPKSL